MTVIFDVQAEYQSLKRLVLSLQQRIAELERKERAGPVFHVTPEWRACPAVWQPPPPNGPVTPFFNIAG
jgi:hypothetical protein